MLRFTLRELLEVSDGHRLMLVLEKNGEFKLSYDTSYRDLKMEGDYVLFKEPSRKQGFKLPKGMILEKVDSEYDKLYSFKDVRRIGFSLFITKEENEYITLMPVKFCKDEQKKREQQDGVVMFKNVPRNKKQRVPGWRVYREFYDVE